MTPDEAVERVKAVAEPRLLPVSHVISRMYETDGNAFRDDLSHLLSRYERMEKALEHLSDPRNQPKGMFGIRDTRITAGWNDAAAIARQALGA